MCVFRLILLHSFSHHVAFLLLFARRSCEHGVTRVLRTLRLSAQLVWHLPWETIRNRYVGTVPSLGSERFFDPCQTARTIFQTTSVEKRLIFSLRRENTLSPNVRARERARACVYIYCVCLCTCVRGVPCCRNILTGICLCLW